MSKIIWFNEYKSIDEEFTASKIDKAEFRSRMSAIGFDESEVDDHLDAALSSMGEKY